VKKSKKPKPGLSIFYGSRGTGKSSVIKFLSSKLERNFIYIPNNLIDLTINSSEIYKFLQKHKNPIIIIDDCEMIFSEFFTKSNVIVNNLMQIIDGPLSNKVKASIITIFNVEDTNEIDHNLMDCNNLVDIIEFSNLSNSEANQLSDFLGYKQKHKSDIRLLDLIKNNKSNNKKRLGF
jgi:predicted AAA+ superfamily ATPase